MIEQTTVSPKNRNQNFFIEQCTLLFLAESFAAPPCEKQKRAEWQNVNSSCDSSLCRAQPCVLDDSMIRLPIVTDRNSVVALVAFVVDIAVVVHDVVALGVLMMMRVVMMVTAVDVIHFARRRYRSSTRPRRHDSSRRRRRRRRRRRCERLVGLFFLSLRSARFRLVRRRFVTTRFRCDEKKESETRT